MAIKQATIAGGADTENVMTSDWHNFGRCDVACFVPAGIVPIGLQGALDTAGKSHSVADIDALDGDPPLSARLIWVIAASERDTRHFAMLRARAEAEALSLVVTVPVEHIDAACDAFDGLPDATILAAPAGADMLAALARHSAAAGAMLHSPLADAREKQIEALQDEVQRIARMLARLSSDSGGDAPREPASPFIEDHQLHAARRSYGAEPGRGGGDVAVATVSARDVRTVIRQRRLRDELFDPELFADPAWDMLLDLYAAKLDRGRVSVSSLCIAAAVPATTALRWIKTLTDSGIFLRQADQHDGRRIFVTLSEAATQAMHRYFARLSEARLAI